MRVSILGCGYVGLVSAAGFAEKGHHVICVDLDPVKVAKVNAAEAPFYEPGLPDLLARHVPARLRASEDLAEAVAATDVTLIAVGTPYDGSQIDLSYVLAACADVGKRLRNKFGYHVVIVKSTVVPGTTDGVIRRTLEITSGKTAGEGFGLGMNPEFLTEGQAVSDLLLPDRIVLGAIDRQSLDVMDRLYEGFDGVPLVRTTTRTAEMIKYASNALLAAMISFSNEFANLCSTIGDIDVAEVLRAVHISRYLSVTGATGERLEAPIARFLEAGCGFGGSCLPKDVKALIARGREAGCPMRLLDAVMAVNERQPHEIVAILRKRLGPLAGRRIAVLGLAFKPDTSDMRESPAVPIIRDLLESSATVIAYDPVAMPEARSLFADGTVEFSRDLNSSLVGVEAAVIVTRWREFEGVPELLRRHTPQPLVLDARRMLDKREVAKYAGVGL